MEFDNKIKPKCSMLIEQDRYVDNGMGGVDPLGHTCYNDAEYSDGVHFYCKECRDKILSGNMGNITYPEFNTVQAWSMLCELIKSGKQIIV